MKALIMTGGRSESLDRRLHRRKKPNLASLVLDMEGLGVDEILITGGTGVKSALSDWFERERGRFETPVTMRFHDTLHDPEKITSLLRVVRHECLEGSLVLLSPEECFPLDLESLGNAFRLHSRSPVIGVRRPSRRLAHASISIGERSRVIRFSSNGERLENEWEPAGVYYFPEGFLSDGLPAFMKSSRVNRPAFESFLAWSVRNFKVYAHVFAAHLGL